MLRTVSLEDALNALGKAFVFIVFGIVALCLFRMAVPMLTAELKQAVAWLMKIPLIFGGITLVAGILWKLAMRPKRRKNTEEL